VWLQEFAWTDEEKYEKYLKRAADGEVGEQLAKEPMFCFGDPPIIYAMQLYKYICFPVQNVSLLYGSVY